MLRDLGEFMGPTLDNFSTNRLKLFSREKGKREVMIYGFDIGEEETLHCG